jgi:predicted Zn finger-like uncharacterized protein
MTLAARCTHCQTAFKVVEDQLRISNGFVRCGHCQKVFHARSTLFEWNELTGEETPVPVTPLYGLVEEPLQSTYDESMPDPAAKILAELEAQKAQVARALAPAEEAVPDPYAQTEIVVFDTQAPGAEPAVADPNLPAQALPLESAAPTMPPETDSASEQGHAQADPDLPRFVQEESSWMQGSPLWTGLALLMALTLVVQLIWHFRDRIAIQVPSTQPLLSQLCQKMGCELQALKIIDDLALESSSFERQGNGNNNASNTGNSGPITHLLRISIRNQGVWPVALPAIELTLTDIQEHVLIRRVLTPQELGAQGDRLQAGEDQVLQAQLSVPPEVSGYRVLAFYP